MSSDQNKYSFLTSPSVESTISDQSGDSGYFPTAGDDSRPRSSMSSTTSDSQTVTGVAIGDAPTKVDALSRHFPKPAEDISVEEMLERPAQKHSLGHWFKNARDLKPLPVDKAKQAKEFEETKKELLRAKEEMQRQMSAR